MIRRLLLTFLLSTSLAIRTSAADGEDFAAAAAAAAQKAIAAGERSVVGADAQWLFLSTELRHLGSGRFWEKDWATVSASKVDPVPIFLDLHDKLKALGVEFIFVPVPAKAAIYPDKFTDASAPDAIAPFLKRLSDGGITVIDLEPLLRGARESKEPASYCMTDSHPSPATCERIAKLVGGHLRAAEWVKTASQASGIKFETTASAEVKIKGDLIPDKKRAGWPAERLPVRKAGTGGKPVPTSDDSPVIVLGDSHALIFHEGGEMLMSGAGVVDHLQAELGFPVSLKASRGSSSQALRQIYKPAAFWEGKKALVWISSAREFTQERRWLKLPRLPK